MNSMRAGVALWLLAPTLAGGCSGVHFRDRQLADRWAPANAALAGAGYLQPYDDHLARLDAHAARQDLATARLLAARHASDLDEILSAPSVPEALEEAIQADWTKASASGAPLARRGDLVSLSRLDATVARLRGNLLRQAVSAEAVRRTIRKRDGTAGDLSCPAMLAAPPPVVPGDEQQLRTACKAAADAQAKLTEELAPIARPRTDVKTALDALRVAERGTDEAGAAALAEDLARQIAASDALAETSAIQAVNDFRARLHALLKDIASPAARIVGLEAASDTIDRLLASDVCARPDAFPPAAVTAAACDAPRIAATTSRAEAIWSFAGAIALLVDTSDRRARSVEWLAGAKAIIDAQKDDARLRVAEAAALRAAAEGELLARVRQVAMLAQARLALNDDARAQCRGARILCAVVRFTDSRNQGAIPAEIWRQRSRQIRIGYGVRRERALAAKQAIVTKAASAQIARYLDTGLDPKVIGQLVVGAGLAGVAAR